MREIKFRGKTEDDMIFEDGKIVDKGTWVYGSLIVNGELPYIVGGVIESDSEYIALEYWYPCDKDSIGQLTGLKDKNGVEIWDGDIIRIVAHMVTLDGKATKDKDSISTYKVFYHPKRCQWFMERLTSNKGRTIGFEEELNYIVSHYWEVIGNIHEDNI